MTLGREPRPLDWWVSPGLLVPVLIPGSESFYPEWTKFMGSWKVNISTDPFPFHPNGFHFWKRDIISEAAARYMWSKQNRVENSSHSDLLPPSRPHLCPWRWEPRERSGTFRATCLHCGEVRDKVRGAPPQAGDGRCGLGPPQLPCQALSDSQLPPHP